MDLNLKSKLFIVCGATSGFGLGITKLLVSEGAYVIASARSEEALNKLSDEFPGKLEVFTGDITRSSTIDKLFRYAGNREIHGMVINAGGPPAMSFNESRLEDWDHAYHQLLRWKVEITKAFLNRMIDQGYGRFVYIESAAVKQYMENLILSTSFRLSVAGFVKTISQELPDKGVTFNILAPGYHDTPALERLIRKKAEMTNISNERARQDMENSIPSKKIGHTGDFASLAVWLLSPLSAYINGQIFAVDGGIIKSIL